MHRLLLLMTLLCAAATVHAQQDTTDRTAPNIEALEAAEVANQIPDEVYEQATAMRRVADSLQQQWKVLWKRSDSIRVESILYRMQGDSLKRSASALVSKHKNDSAIAVDVLREKSLRRLFESAIQNLKRKNAGALTFADSITAAVMVVEPDTGVASFYANAFHGKKTSNGEVYDMNGKSCAHRWLPFGTLVRVRNLSNGKETVVRVNDRGPWKHSRLIDLSKGAAVDIDMVRAGTTRVRITVEPKIPETVEP